MKKLSALLLILISCFNLTYGQEINTKKLDSLFDAISINNKMTGSIEIVKDKKIVYQKALGYSKGDGENIPNDFNTIFRIGSTTKMLTAIIVFQLIEEGKLKLDSKLSDYFPKIPNSEKITIATLLSHRSGLYDIVNDADNKDWLKTKQTQKNLLDTIVLGQTHFAPEKAFSYSNSGYLLLTYIIEKVTKKEYSKVLKQRIISKLNLKNTFSIKSNESQKNEALPYKFDKNWSKIADFYFPNVIGVGDVLSNPKDLNIIIGSLFDGKLISKNNLALMQKTGEGGFGMGLMKTPFKKNIGYGHGGDTFGSHSVVTFFPKDNLSLALCINGQVLSRNEIGIAVLKICFNQEYKIPSFKTIELDNATLEKYCGTYSTSQMPLKFNVSTKDNKLLVQATGQDSIELEPIDVNKFQVQELQAFFEFDSEAKRMTFKQGGAIFIFNKE